MPNPPSMQAGIQGGHAEPMQLSGAASHRAAGTTRGACQATAVGFGPLPPRAPLAPATTAAPRGGGALPPLPLRGGGAAAAAAAAAADGHRLTLLAPALPPLREAAAAIASGAEAPRLPLPFALPEGGGAAVPPRRLLLPAPPGGAGLWSRPASAAPRLVPALAEGGAEPCKGTQRGAAAERSGVQQACTAMAMSAVFEAGLKVIMASMMQRQWLVRHLAGC